MSRLLKRSLQIRHVDAGSCNGCEAELQALLAPHYDMQRYGIDVVASPRHADAVTVSGPVSTQMADALRRTVEAAGEPRLVLALGDCAIHGCVFRGAPAAHAGVADVVTVDAAIPGCPPTPAQILAHLLAIMERRP